MLSHYKTFSANDSSLGKKCVRPIDPKALLGVKALLSNCPLPTPTGLAVGKVCFVWESGPDRLATPARGVATPASDLAYV